MGVWILEGSTGFHYVFDPYFGAIAVIGEDRKPRHAGRPVEGHHTFSAVLYPHLANHGEIIYPATHFEHLQAWHGGNYRKSLPGRRIRRFNEF